MQSSVSALLKPPAEFNASAPRKLLVNILAWSFIGGLYLLLPLLPLLVSIAYQRRKYVMQYGTTLKKMVVHLQAISEGPVHHYLHDVAGRHKQVPVQVEGECTQCGNCCLNKRCAFLEQVGENQHQCGIYSAPLRRYSNCGSFPLHAQDIERYACPGYTVVKEAPIHWAPRAAVE